jgi:aryl-alcohol dehydrogenase-like predicted oxidoreductase
LGIGVIPYSPLAAGFATGKYSRENKQADTSRENSNLIKRLLANEKAFDALDVLNAIAAEHGVPTGQIALAWLFAQPTVTSPIIGARKVEQLEEALGAVELKLSEEQIQRLNQATEGF